MGDGKGSLEAVVNCLQRENRIVLIGHSIPDGDCIGACFGLGLALEEAGKEVGIIITDPIPPIYNYLAGSHLLRNPSSIVPGGVFCYLDCADQERTGALPPDFASQARVVVNIDHHVSNKGFGDYCWVQPQAAATCEICLSILDAMGITPSFQVANALYTGIVMDTGSFQYSSVTPQTLRTAARLLDYGADKDLIRQALFEAKSLTEMRVLGLTICNMKFNHDHRLGWSSLSQNELASVGAADLHFEGIINHIRNIEGVQIAILFREISENKIKLGFRSRGTYDVNQIAAYWGGGGHRLAAGASVEGKLEEVMAEVIARVEALLI